MYIFKTVFALPCRELIDKHINREVRVVSRCQHAENSLSVIHASFGDDDAIFSIEDGEILEGTLPRNKRKLVEAWIEIHRDDLLTDWRLAVSGQNPIPIIARVLEGIAYNPEVQAMKDEYDFSNSKPNPYSKLLKKEVKIKIDEDALLYFKNLALELGIPYQNLINSYLRDCVQHHRKPAVKWA